MAPQKVATQKLRFCRNSDDTLCFRTLRGEIDPGESEFDLESIKQKYGFCKNYDDTLWFRTLRGEIDPGEPEFEVDSIKDMRQKT